MQIEVVRKQPGGNWNAFSMFARQRVSIMTSRIQYGHRRDGMMRGILVEKGLLKEIIERKVDESGKTRTGRKYEPIDDSEETTKAIEEEMTRISAMPVYVKMTKYWKELQRFEKEMEKDAIEMVQGYEVTKFCEQTYGLGYIGALTFLGYYNPLRTKSPSNWMSMLGWTPNSKLKRGEQGHSNPVAKGRTYMCTHGVILKLNKYYKPLYDEKKRYLSLRPDFVYERDILKKKGVKAHIDRLANEYNVKLILNHVYCLMYEDYWGVPYYMSDDYHNIRHHNHVPIPTRLIEEEWPLVHEIARRIDDRILVDAQLKWNEFEPWREWDNKESERVKQWKNWVAHIPLELYMQQENIPKERTK